MAIISPMCAEEANNRPPKIPGRPGTQKHVQRNPTDVALEHSFWPTFLHFCYLPTPVQPHWSPGGAKVPGQNAIWFLNGARGTLQKWKKALNIEIWLCRDVPLFWACQLQEFWSAVRIPHSWLWVILNVWEEPPAHFVTACENMDSTLREEPPKTVIFFEVLGRSCNIDEPEWNWSITREAMESISTAHLGCPGVYRIRRRRGSWATLDGGPCESQCHALVNMSHRGRPSSIPTNSYQA